MTKTINYNLNKPEATDPLRVEDFNENAEKIDAALNSVRSEAANNLAAYKTSTDAAVAAVNTALGSKAEQSAVNKVAADLAGLIVTGTYAGTANAGTYDTTTQTITLGFQPRFLMVRNTGFVGSDGWSPKNLAFATPAHPHYAYSGEILVTITATGFVAGGTNSKFNSIGATYEYLAIR